MAKKTEIDIKQLQAEHKEAQEKLLNTKWKTEVCQQGASCWCRSIVPVEEIRYSGDEEMYVVGQGEMAADVAAYIVKLHNEHLEHR